MRKYILGFNYYENTSNFIPLSDDQVPYYILNRRSYLGFRLIRRSSN